MKTISHQLQGIITILALLLTACSSTPKTGTVTHTGQVTKVHDGDSIHITPPGQKRIIIRLAGIDAPEIKQPGGIASRDKLRSMILNRTASARCHKKDRYRRSVCVVYFNGKDMNLAMVRAGLAWHYKQYQNEQTRLQRWQYSRGEQQARRSGRGLWADDNRMPPWKYRKQRN